MAKKTDTTIPGQRGGRATSRSVGADPQDSEHSSKKRNKRDPDRDEKGRYIKGHASAGPGRPRKELCISDLTREYLEAETTVPIKDGRKIVKYRTDRNIQFFVESQVQRAINGDGAAARNVWHYVEGIPVQRLKVENATPVDAPVNIFIGVEIEYTDDDGEEDEGTEP